MISEWNFRLGSRYSWKPQVGLFYGILAATLIGATFAFSLLVRAPVINRVQHVGAKLVAGSPAQVAQAWGAPTQTIPGPQVNQNLPANVTCYLWQSKHALLCF